MLRAKGVVGKFVECFGDGVATLSATQRTHREHDSRIRLHVHAVRSTNRTLEYLLLTGRDKEQVALVEALHAKAQGMWNDGASRVYSEVPRAEFERSRVLLADPEPSA